jgi:hypothetical protein
MADATVHWRDDGAVGKLLFGRSDVGVRLLHLCLRCQLLGIGRLP